MLKCLAESFQMPPVTFNPQLIVHIHFAVNVVQYIQHGFTNTTIQNNLRNEIQ